MAAFAGGTIGAAGAIARDFIRMLSTWIQTVATFLFPSLGGAADLLKAEASLPRGR